LRLIIADIEANITVRSVLLLEADDLLGRPDGIGTVFDGRRLARDKACDAYT
jgi:hypothetical protein